MFTVIIRTAKLHNSESTNKLCITVGRQTIQIIKAMTNRQTYVLDLFTKVTFALWPVPVVN